MRRPGQEERRRKAGVRVGTSEHSPNGRVLGCNVVSRKGKGEGVRGGGEMAIGRPRKVSKQTRPRD